MLCGQAPGALESTNVTVGAASQASLTVGVGKLGVAGHSIVCGPAQVMLGAVVSTTVMLWLQLAWLPQWSVAVQVRV